MADVRDPLKKAIEPLAKKYGAELQLVARPQVELRTKRRACEVAIDLFETLGAPPPAEGGRLVRGMLNQ